MPGRSLEPDETVCQAWGGARAWKGIWGEAAEAQSASMVSCAGPTLTGNMKDGAVPGIKPFASCTDAHTAHWSWAVWDFTGSGGLAGAPGVVADAGANSCTSSAGNPLPLPGTCT